MCVENVLCDADTLQEKEEAAVEAADAVLGKVNSSLLNNSWDTVNFTDHWSSLVSRFKTITDS